MGFLFNKVNNGEKRPRIIASKAFWIFLLILLSPQIARADDLYTYLNATTTIACVSGLNPPLSTNGYVGFEFTAPASGSVSNISLEVSRLGSPTDDIFVEVWTASGSSLGSLVASSTPIAGATFTEDPGHDWKQFNFASPVTFTIGSKYFILTARTGVSDLVNRWCITGHDSGSYDGIDRGAQMNVSNTFDFSNPIKINTIVGDTAPPDANDFTTRIISFHPLEGTTQSTSSVHFDINAYINNDDVGNIIGIRISLHNINQNTLGWLLGNFAPDDFDIVNQNVQDPGFFYAATDTPIAIGNYRIRACLKRTYFFGWVQNNFANIIDDARDCQSHQFVVGTSTFVGSLSQNGFNEYNDFINGLSATSTEALARTCNPINLDFGIRECLTYLLIPGGDALDNTLQGLRQGILVRVPWGYATRVATILSNPATTTLPSWTASIRIASSTYTTLSFNPGDMLAGAGSLVDSIRDPVYNVNLRDIFYTICQLIVAIAVIMTIFADITKSHEHVKGEHNGRE